MESWKCLICGFIYEEDKGDTNTGIPPGTIWKDIPQDWICPDWICPDCGAVKDDFEQE